MGVNNSDGDGSGVDGDSSGGNSPSSQGAGTETYVPRNWSSMAAALRNFSWMDTDSFRVFASEAIYRWKGDVRGHPRGPHHGLARVGALLRLCFGLRLHVGIGGLAFVLSNSENISCITFLKYKIAQNRNWHYGILLIG
jgi:hypothetical protein